MVYSIGDTIPSYVRSKRLDSLGFNAKKLLAYLNSDQFDQDWDNKIGLFFYGDDTNITSIFHRLAYDFHHIMEHKVFVTSPLRIARLIETDHLDIVNEALTCDVLFIDNFYDAATTCVIQGRERGLFEDFIRDRITHSFGATNYFIATNPPTSCEWWSSDLYNLLAMYTRPFGMLKSGRG